MRSLINLFTVLVMCLCFVSTKVEASEGEEVLLNPIYLYGYKQNSANLTTEMLNKLTLEINSMGKLGSKHSIRVYTYADSTGTFKYNLALSERRKTNLIKEIKFLCPEVDIDGTARPYTAEDNRPDRRYAVVEIWGPKTFVQDSQVDTSGIAETIKSGFSKVEERIAQDNETYAEILVDLKNTDSKQHDELVKSQEAVVTALATLQSEQSDKLSSENLKSVFEEGLKGVNLETSISKNILLVAAAFMVLVVFLFLFVWLSGIKTRKLIKEIGGKLYQKVDRAAKTIPKHLHESRVTDSPLERHQKNIPVSVNSKKYSVVCEMERDEDGTEQWISPYFHISDEHLEAHIIKPTRKDLINSLKGTIKSSKFRDQTKRLEQKSIITLLVNKQEKEV